MNELEFFLNSFNLRPEIVQKAIEMNRTGRLSSSALTQMLLQSGEPQQRISYIVNQYAESYNPTHAYNQYQQQPNEWETKRMLRMEEKMEKLFEENQRRDEEERQRLIQERDRLYKQLLQPTVAPLPPAPTSEQNVPKFKPAPSPTPTTAPSPTPTTVIYPPFQPSPSPEILSRIDRQNEFLRRLEEKVDDVSKRIETPPRTVIEQIPEPKPEVKQIDWRSFVGCDVKKQGLGDTANDIYLNEMVAEGFPRDWVERVAREKHELPPLKTDKEDEEGDDDE